MKTELQFASAASVESELLVAFAVNDADKKDTKAAPKVRSLLQDGALEKATAAVLGSGEFSASSCETLLVHSPDGLKAKRLLVVGLAKADANELRKAAGAAVRFAKPRGIRSLTLLLPGGDDFSAAETARAAAEGAFVGDFDPDTYRSDRKDRSVESVTFIAPEDCDRAATEASFRDGVIIGEAQNFTRTLVNEPGNVMTPTELGRRAAAMAAEHGLKCEVHSTEKLKELKMGAFWAVSQGSAEPPALIVLTYEPAGNAGAGGPVLGLVGKGITFDTGGISIKPAEGMEKMKYDMAGGAAMIGAMKAIAELKPDVRVIGVICSAENMPSGTAYKPGDIMTAMSGKTIEIINTDAEGRMVLADGLHYAKQLGATHLIDAATLTGACVVALGMVNAGVFSNDDETYAHFVSALKASGERFWRLPVEDEYREQIKSNIADIMNTGGRWGGAVTAAMFLKEFVDETSWIHLDIAGVAWTEEAKPWIAKGPSGIAVRSITEWVRTYSK